MIPNVDTGILVLPFALLQQAQSPDMPESEILQEIDDRSAAHSLLMDVLSGDGDLEYYLDLIEALGVSPGDYIASCCQNVELIVNGCHQLIL